MKLSGWHRLWILVSIVYLCVVVGGAFILYSEEGSVSELEVFKEMSPDTGEKLRKYYSEGILLRGTDLAFISVAFEDSHLELFFPKSISKKELGALSDEFHDAIPKALKRKQWSFLLWASMFWIIPCILLYVLGRSVGWVYRGFKGSK